MNVVGLGSAGCNIADKFANYPQYSIYKIDVGLTGLKKDGIFDFPEQKSTAHYETNCPSFKNFFKNINNHFKVNLFLDKKVDKNLLKGFNKVIVNKSNKFRNKLYLVHHQLARVDYEKEKFPGYVQNQTFGIGSGIF